MHIIQIAFENVIGIERTISWLGAYRRLPIRWERQDDMYEAFVMIACSMFCLRRVLI